MPLPTKYNDGKIRYYLLIYTETEYWLVGPWRTSNAAYQWGKKHRSPGGVDDPRWQVMHLKNMDPRDEYDTCRVWSPGQQAAHTNIPGPKD